MSLSSVSKYLILSFTSWTHSTLLDPTDSEVSLSNGRLSIAVTDCGELCGVYKSGECVSVMCPGMRWTVLLLTSRVWVHNQWTLAKAGVNVINSRPEESFIQRTVTCATESITHFFGLMKV